MSYGELSPISNHYLEHFSIDLSKMSSSWGDQLIDPPIYATIKEAKPPKFFVEPTLQLTKPKTKDSATKENIGTLKMNTAWEMATAPLKSLPMTLIMNYMTGNSLQIISISMTLNLFTGPLNSIANINESFRFLDTDNDKTLNRQAVMMVKLTFIMSHLVTLLYGLWKLNKMGLIPNSTSDWISWESLPQFNELSLGVF